jgi:hypothetical protein
MKSPSPIPESSDCPLMSSRLRTGFRGLRLIPADYNCRAFGVLRNSKILTDYNLIQSVKYYFGSDFKPDPLGQGQFCAIVNGIRLSSHINLP